MKHTQAKFFTSKYYKKITICRINFKKSYLKLNGYYEIFDLFVINGYYEIFDLFVINESLLGGKKEYDK